MNPKKKKKSNENKNKRRKTFPLYQEKEVGILFPGVEEDNRARLKRRHYFSATLYQILFLSLLLIFITIKTSFIFHLKLSLVIFQQ